MERSAAEQPEVPDAPLVVAAFLARYLADREAGEIQTPAAYEAMFPGFEAVVARELRRLSTDTATRQTAPPDVSGQWIGPYRIVREIGRGGQGIVYLADDPRLSRQVALKILPGALGPSTVQRQRFLREAKVAARLDVPGICTVFDAGEAEGIAYIAMRYVTGESLQAAIQAANASGTPRGRDHAIAMCALGARCARTLHEAHEAGLVHRDVKPANVMISPDGAPVLLDFGLARADGGDATLTADGELLGTPAYMSPEQLQAEQARIDRRTDVFSLAVTLYEAITGVHPFAATTRAQLLDRILHSEPENLHRLAPAAPRNLGVVIACALDKDRDRRYATAAAFAEDLHAAATGNPIAARPIGALRRIARWARCHPAIATASALGSAAVLGFAAWTHVKNGELDRALGAEQHARAASDAMALAANARSLIDLDGELATLLARDAVTKSASPTTTAALQLALAQHHTRRVANADAPGANWVVFSPDSRLCAFDADARIIVQDANGANLATIAEPGAAHALVAFAPGGSRLLVAGDNFLVTNRALSRTVHLGDARSGAMIAELAGHRGILWAAEFSTDGRWLATGDGEASAHEPHEPHQATVRLWDAADGRLVATWPGHDKGIMALAFTGHGTADAPELVSLDAKGVLRTLATAGARAAAWETGVASLFEASHQNRWFFDATKQRLWFATFQEPVVFDLQAKRTTVVAEAAGAALVGSQNSGLLLGFADSQPFAHSRGRRTQPILLRTDRTTAGPWLGDHRERPLAGAITRTNPPRIVVLNEDGAIRVFDPQGRRILGCPGVGAEARVGTVSPDGQLAALVTESGRVLRWHVFESAALPSRHDVDEIPPPALAADGTWFACARGGHTEIRGIDGALRWRAPSRDEPEVLTPAPDGRRLAITDSSGATVVVEVADGTTRTMPFSGGDAVSAITFDRDSRRLAAIDETGRLQVVDVTAGSPLGGLQLDLPGTGLAFLPADRIAVSTMSGTRLVSLPDCKVLFDGRTLSPSHVAGVSAQGDRVLLLPVFHSSRRSVSRRGPALVLDTSTGAPACQFQDAAGNDVQWSCGVIAPDGAHVVLGDETGTLRWFAAPSGALVTTVAAHRGSIDRLRLSADGAVLLTSCEGFFGDNDESLRVFDGRTGALRTGLPLPSGGSNGTTLSADGRWFAYTTRENRLVVHPVDPLPFADALALREPTAAERQRFGLPAAGH